MIREKLPKKFGRKSVATVAALILAEAGISAVNKETNRPDTAHDKVTTFSSIPPFANYPVPASESQYVETSYKKFLNTWTRQNPSMRQVSLDLVLSETTSCNSNPSSMYVINSNDKNGLEFCASENKVIITRAGINLINELTMPDEDRLYSDSDKPANYRPQVEHQLLNLVITHELGHAVQLANTGEVKPGDMHTELQADCYAGQAYRDNKSRTSYNEIENLYKLIESGLDQTHGTAVQRSASFERGFTEGSCT